MLVAKIRLLAQNARNRLSHGHLQTNNFPIICQLCDISPESASRRLIQPCACVVIATVVDACKAKPTRLKRARGERSMCKPCSAERASNNRLLGLVLKARARRGPYTFSTTECAIAKASGVGDVEGGDYRRSSRGSPRSRWKRGRRFVSRRFWD